MTLAYGAGSWDSHTDELSSDNVAHRIYDHWHAAMPLQLYFYLRISENRACHSLKAKERILRALS